MQTMHEARHPTPLPIRIYRVVRASLHLAEGLATIVLVFPWTPHVRRQALIRRWSARLLRVFGIETAVEGRLHDERERGTRLPVDLVRVAAPVALDEQRAHPGDEPADDRPSPELRLGDESRRLDRVQHEDVEP